MSAIPPQDLASNAQAPDATAEDIPLDRRTKGDPAVAREIAGRDGPEPTRFGDWEKNGRCIDF